MWDGGKSILQVKERLVVRGQEEGVSYTRTGWILRARRLWLCLSANAVTGSSPGAPQSTQQW